MWCCCTTIIRKALFAVLIKIEETLLWETTNSPPSSVTEPTKCISQTHKIGFRSRSIQGSRAPQGSSRIQATLILWHHHCNMYSHSRGRNHCRLSLWPSNALPHIWHITSRHSSLAKTNHMAPSNLERMGKCHPSICPRERRTGCGGGVCTRRLYLWNFWFVFLIFMLGTCEKSKFFLKNNSVI